MSTDANKEVVRRFICDVVNTGNIDIISDIIDPDYTEIHEGKRYPIVSKEQKNTLLE